MSKFNAKDYNFVAKRLRENFPIDTPPDQMTNPAANVGTHLQRGVVVEIAIDFAKKYQEDNPNFDPLQFLDQCSPDTDRYPFSELWENK